MCKCLIISILLLNTLANAMKHSHYQPSSMNTLKKPNQQDYYYPHKLPFYGALPQHASRIVPRPMTTQLTSFYPNSFHNNEFSNLAYFKPQSSFNVNKMRYQNFNQPKAKTVQGKRKLKPMSGPSYPIRINPYTLALAGNAIVIRDPFMSPYTEVQEEFNPFGLEMKSFLSPYPLNLKIAPLSFYNKQHNNHLQNV